MILEVAILDVKSGQENEFENAFKKAQEIIMPMPGYLSHELLRCIENNSRYLLLVKWQQLEDHTNGFRESVEYQQWQAMLHHFYAPLPEVEHYHTLLKGGANKI